MPTISKIRFTNVVYESGNKRYTDELFHFQGENSAIVLENGGGKTVFIQAAIQAILPHESLANRKIKETLSFDDGPAHIAIEWILNDRPRRYALTAVTIFPYQNGIETLRYVYEYGPGDLNRIDLIPFTFKLSNGDLRIASYGEMKEYMTKMSQSAMSAKTFPSIISFTEYIEKNFQIISNEWKSIVKINSAEGGVEAFFDACPTEKALYEKLLIPTVEKSIVAYDDKKFADIFESQREKFQIYKKLKEQLIEYEAIQQQLQSYVDSFKQLHNKQQSFEQKKMRAKAFERLIVAETDHKEAQVDHLMEQKAALQTNKEKHNLKEKCYDIAVVQQQLDEKNFTVEQLQNEKDKCEEKLQQQLLELANLKYARAKLFLKESKEKQTNIEEQIKRLDEHLSNKDLLEKLDEVKSAISGDFAETKERFNEVLANLNQQINILTRNCEEQEKEYLSLQEVVQKARDEVLKKQQSVEYCENEMAQLSPKLFDQEVESIQSITVLRNQFVKESQQLDDQIIEMQEQVNNVKDLLDNMQKKLNTHQEHEKSLIRMQSTVEEKLNQFRMAQETMQQTLLANFPSFTRIQNLPLNEQSILQQIEAMVEKRKRDYDMKLNLERLTYRHVDDYGGQNSFFADSFVAKQLEKWKSQFTFLETAIQFFEEEEAVRLDGALLAITLITNEHEIPFLEEKLHRCAMQLTYPIQIWSLQDATAIIKKEKQPSIQLLEPTYWKDHSQIEKFKEWQESVQKKADEATSDRILAGNDLELSRQIQQQLIAFYKSYSLEKLQQFQSEKQEISENLFLCQQNIKSIKKQLDNAEIEREQKNEHIKINEEKKRHIDQKIVQILRYEKLYRQCKELKEELVYLEQNFKNVKRTAEMQKRQLLSLRQELEGLQDEIKDEQYKQKVYFAERTLYKEVEQIKPSFTGESYETLKQKYENLTKEIDGITQGRSILLATVNDEQARQKNLLAQLEELKIEQPFLEDTYHLPLNVDEQIKQLPTDIRDTEEEYKLIVNKLNQEEKKASELVGEIKQLKKDIDHIIIFDHPLSIIRKQLDDEAQQLNIQQQHLGKTVITVQEILKELKGLLQDLKIADGRHQFLAPQVVVAQLLVEEQTDFQYKRKLYIEQTIYQLDQESKIVDKNMRIVENVKQIFQQFCRERISDFRLREAAIQGIQGQKTYEEVVKHKENVQKTIFSSMQYAQTTMKTYNDEIEHFIN